MPASVGKLAGCRPLLKVERRLDVSEGSPEQRAEELAQATTWSRIGERPRKRSLFQACSSRTDADSLRWPLKCSSSRLGTGMPTYLAAWQMQHRVERSSASGLPEYRPTPGAQWASCIFATAKSFQNRAQRLSVSLPFSLPLSLLRSLYLSLSEVQLSTPIRTV